MLRTWRTTMRSSLLFAALSLWLLLPHAADSSLRGSVAARRPTTPQATTCPTDNNCRALDGQRFACHACHHCQWYHRADVCLEQDSGNPPLAALPTTTTTTTTTTTSSTTTLATTTAAPQPAASFCGCPSCTAAVWNRPTDAAGFTCGFRMHYLTTAHGGNHTHAQACTHVATQHASACAPCHATTCHGRTPHTVEDYNFRAGSQNDVDATTDPKEYWMSLGMMMPTS